VCFSESEIEGGSQNLFCLLSLQLDTKFKSCVSQNLFGVSCSKRTFQPEVEIVEQQLEFMFGVLRHQNAD
jgi:hypothetical protein